MFGSELIYNLMTVFYNISLFFLIIFLFFRYFWKIPPRQNEINGDFILISDLFATLKRSSLKSKKIFRTS